MKYVTIDEIKNQPKMWLDTLNRVKAKKSEIDSFFEKIKEENVNVIFTGAGTSNYVGDVIYPHFNKVCDKKYNFLSIPTTDIVSNPEQFLVNKPTILVSFARSGNSPESVAAIKLAEKCIDKLYQIVVTCSETGALAKKAENEENTLLMLLNKETNDKGFAMTSSFSSMAVCAIAIFDKNSFDSIEKMAELGEKAINDEEKFKEVASLEFDRIVYLGSGSLGKLAREAQLKILELTAGKVTTCFDSSLGFRHGPKSYVDEKTLIVDFVSNNKYTRLYDIDIINEISQDSIAKLVYPVYIDKNSIFENGYRFENGEELEDVYLAFIYVIAAQFIAVHTAIRVKNDVDNPSSSGTVNRVVKGVTIHEF